MQSRASIAARSPALIVATLLLGLVATIAIDPQKGDATVVDAIGLFLGS